MFLFFIEFWRLQLFDVSASQMCEYSYLFMYPNDGNTEELNFTNTFATAIAMLQLQRAVVTRTYLTAGTRIIIDPVGPSPLAEKGHGHKCMQGPYI